MNHRPKMPLGLVPVGTKVIIRNIVGGSGVRRKLSGMGFAKDTALTVLGNDEGRMLVAVGESRFALGFGIAQKVIVEHAEQVPPLT